MLEGAGPRPLPLGLGSASDVENRSAARGAQIQDLIEFFVRLEKQFQNPEIQAFSVLLNVYFLRFMKSCWFTTPLNARQFSKRFVGK